MHVLCRPSLSVRAANLLLMNLERISICHVKLCRSESQFLHATLNRVGAQEWRARNDKETAYRFRTVGWLYTAAIEEKPDRSGSLALSLAEGIHQLL
jgi:hypothetical protein